MKKLLTVAAALGAAAGAQAQISASDLYAGTFRASDQVTVERVAFKNQYQMEVVGNLFLPKGIDPAARHAAVVVGHPMGAVKEQAANLYAVKMAERGFVALSIDLSFWGESAGAPRNGVSAELYAEDFSAAVDYLGTHPMVDRARIGAIGICGSGGFALSAAKIDPRIKAVATVSMYDMGAATRSSIDKAALEAAAEQRYAEFQGAEPAVSGGTVVALTDESGPVEREFYGFYRNPARGEFTPAGASPLRATKPTVTGSIKFVNFYPFHDLELISPRPVLFVAGSEAHSIAFSQEAYRRAAEPKELYCVEGAGHADLYDRLDKIPFDKLDSFFTQYLK